MVKRTVKGRSKRASEAEARPETAIEDTAADSPSGDDSDEESEPQFDSDASLDDDSDALSASDDDSGSEDGDNTTGLDAIIAASRKRAGAPRAGPSDPGDDSDNDSDAGAAEGAALRERRGSGRLASSSLLRDEAFMADGGSDSSEDERPDRNTIGDVPLEWYNEEDHIGYDRSGEKLVRRGPGNDRLDALLARNDSPSLALRTIYDAYNDEKLVLSREELKILMNIQKGHMPEVAVNPYEDLVDWYSSEADPFPMQNAPEPKRRFMPSKWEEKRVVKLVRAIRRGWIKPRQDDDEAEKPPPVYLMWEDDATASEKTGAGLTHIPPPKPDLPGHEESYRPPEEYLPSEEQRAAYSLLDDEDRPAFVPRAFGSLREVPQFSRIVHERFERCLDLYLCPRVRSKRVNYKPEDLVPKALPKPQDLRPFPNRLAVTYEGHASKVRCVCPDGSGQWLLTGSDDGTMRLWEVSTGRCQKTWNLGAKVHRVAWCPDGATRLVSAVVENRVVLLPSGLGGAAVADAAAAALDVPAEDDSAERVVARWLRRDDGGVDVVHNHQLRHFCWHGRGDYFATVAPSGATQSVVVHQLSKRSSQNPFRKSRGRVTCCAFHPTKPFFLVAAETNVRIYNLAKQALAKKLLAGGGVVTSIDVHASGDHVILGTEDKRCLWFDLDLSSKPYKTMKYHEAAVKGVGFHKKYPLFASGSDDGTAHVFHGMVYQDLMTNPLIVPVKILREHRVHDYAGVLDVAFHPSQPWLFTAGGDGNACLFVDC